MVSNQVGAVRRFEWAGALHNRTKPRRETSARQTPTRAVEGLFLFDAEFITVRSILTFLGHGALLIVPRGLNFSYVSAGPAVRRCPALRIESDLLDVHDNNDDTAVLGQIAVLTA